MSRRDKKNNKKGQQSDTDNDEDSYIHQEDFKNITKVEDLKVWKRYIKAVYRDKLTKTQEKILEELELTASQVKNIRVKYGLVSPYRLKKTKRIRRKKKDEEEEEENNDGTKTDTEETKTKKSSSKKKKEKSRKSSKNKKSSKSEESTPKLDMNLSGGGPDDEDETVSVKEQVLSQLTEEEILELFKKSKAFKNTTELASKMRSSSSRKNKEEEDVDISKKYDIQTLLRNSDNNLKNVIVNEQN